MTGTIDEDMLANQLTVVLIWCQHESIDSIGTSLRGQGAYHIVSLESIDLKDGNPIGFQQVFDDGHGLTDILWRLLALGLVGREGLAAEGGSMGIEGHADMGGLFLREHLVQRVEEAHDGTCIQSFRVDSRVLDERIITAIDERISV